jgi:rhamnogalacturonyl hydrolase YesR
MKNSINLPTQKPWIITTMLVIILVTAANSQNIEAFLRPYADDIIHTSSFEFTDKESGKKFYSTKDLPLMINLKVEPVYLRWHYTSALVHDGLLSLGTVVDNKDYSGFGMKYFQFVFDNQVYLDRIMEEGYIIEGLERFGRFRGIWDNGAQAAALIKIYEHDPRPEYLEYLEQVAEFFFQYDVKAENSTRRKNIDKIYTQGVFMARMGKLSGESKYFDYCVEKVLELDSLFYDPRTGLYDQMYYPEQKTTNRMKWLRGIGWSSMALVNILECLPENHPGYDEVLNIYRKQVAGISSFQAKSGLWKHLVDHPGSYEETSGSVYIVYAIARGVNDGYLDPMFRDVAMAGWQGIVSKRQTNGDIAGSTPGVSSSTSPSYYLTYPTVNNGDHLFGPLFLAGAEMIKLLNSYGQPVPKDWDLMKQ